MTYENSLENDSFLTYNCQNIYSDCSTDLYFHLHSALPWQESGMLHSKGTRWRRAEDKEGIYHLNGAMLAFYLLGNGSKHSFTQSYLLFIFSFFVKTDCWPLMAHLQNNARRSMTTT